MAFPRAPIDNTAAGETVAAVLKAASRTSVPRVAFLAAAVVLAALCLWRPALLRIARVAGLLLWSRRARYPLAAAVFVCAAYLSTGPFQQWHNRRDEAAYLLQARTYAAGMWARDEPTTVYPITAINENGNFFLSVYEVVKGRKAVVFYSPTYPLFLAVGVVARVPWLPNAACAAAAVLLGAAAARRLYGEKEAAAAAWLFASSPALVTKGGTYLSEIFFVTVFLCFVILYAKYRDGRSAAAAFALGLVWAFMFSARELSTLGATAPFVVAWLVSAFRKREYRKLFFCAGAVGGLLPLFVYNIFITGKPWLFPRFVSPFPQFSRESGDLVAVTFVRFWELNTDGLGWPYLSLLPLVVCAVGRRRSRVDYLWLGVVLGTAAAFFPVNAFGIDFGTRYFVGAAIALVFLGSRLLTLAEERRRGSTLASRLAAAAPAVALVFVIAGFAATLGTGARKGRGPLKKDDFWETPELRRALQQLDVHNAVIFVGPHPHGYSAMPNSPRLDDDIIFARDQGRRNAELMALFPGRKYYRCHYPTFEEQGIIEELAPLAAARRCPTGR